MKLKHAIGQYLKCSCKRTALVYILSSYLMLTIGWYSPIQTLLSFTLLFHFLLLFALIDSHESLHWTWTLWIYHIWSDYLFKNIFTLIHKIFADDFCFSFVPSELSWIPNGSAFQRKWKLQCLFIDKFSPSMSSALQIM